MAAEGQEVVGSTAEVSTTTDTQKAENTQQSTQSSAAGAGSPPDKSGELERQVAGIKAELIRERKQRQQYETDWKSSQQALDVEKKRVAAALGITPQSTEDAETEQIRKAFAARFPELASLTKEDIDALREMRATAGNLAETTSHYWTQHASQMVGSVISEVAKELGGNLSDRQAKRLASAYAQEAEANPEFLARHEKGDKTLIAEFAKQWIEDWYEPARRKVTQLEVGRQRVLPSGKDRSLVTHGEKKIDVTDDKAVEDMLVKGFRERNGEFSRR